MARDFQRFRPMDAVAAGAVLVPPSIVAFAASLPIDRFPEWGLDAVYYVHRYRAWLLGAAVPPLAYLALGRPRSPATRFAVAGLGAVALASAVLVRPFAGGATGARALSPEEADRLLSPRDEVLGVEIGGEARAYPRDAIQRPHTIHDVVGGVPLVPTFCDLTSSALAFRDEAPGGQLDLRAIGELGNNLTFYEGRTRGVVQQLEARISAGPHAGAPIETVPLTLTTWRTWRTFHPRSTALHVEPGWRDRVLARISAARRRRVETSRDPLYPLGRPVDGRLAAKERVLGVATRGWAKAFSRVALAERRVVEDAIHGLPIVVLYDGDHDIAMAFDRRIDGRTLAFRPAIGGTTIAEDAETGARFDVFGRAVPGPLGGRRLAPIPFQVDKVYWFAWAYFRPETELVGASASARAARLAPEESETRDL